MDLESRQSVEAGTYLQLGTFSIFTFFQQEVSLLKKKQNKTKKQKKDSNKMWKSRIDSEVRDFQLMKKQSIMIIIPLLHIEPFFFGGGEREDREGCFIFLLLVGSKNVEYQIILSTGWEGIIEKL